MSHTFESRLIENVFAESEQIDKFRSPTKILSVDSHPPHAVIFSSGEISVGDHVDTQLFSQFIL